MPPKPYGNGSSRPLSPVERELDRLIKVAVGDTASPNFEWPSPGVLPAAEVSETAEHWSFSVDLPGHDPASMKIELANEHLVIESERRDEKDARGETFHTSERYYGRFRRSFPLPPGVDTQGVEATYRSGVLQVIVPKKPEAKPRKIHIVSDD